MNLSRAISRFPWALAAIIAVSVYLAKLVAENGFGMEGFPALMFGTMVAGIICTLLCVVIEKTTSISLFPAPLPQEEDDNHDD